MFYLFMEVYMNLAELKLRAERAQLAAIEGLEAVRDYQALLDLIEYIEIEQQE